MISSFISAWGLSPRGNKLINNSLNIIYEKLIKKIARPRNGKVELGISLRTLSEEEIFIHSLSSVLNMAPMNMI